MSVSVPKEPARGERRVALVPEVVAAAGQGRRGRGDRGRRGRGGPPSRRRRTRRPAPRSATALGAEVVAKVAPPSAEEIGRLARGSVLIGFLAPAHRGRHRARAGRGRASRASPWRPSRASRRAQSMDALSSQATVAGYRAALIAAQELPRFFPMLTTAAGTVRPPRCSCWAPAWPACRRSPPPAGSARSCRPSTCARAVKEQIESLGARFLELDMGLEDAEARRRLRAGADRGGAAAPARAARRGDRRDGRGRSHRRRARAAGRRCW